MAHSSHFNVDFLRMGINAEIKENPNVKKSYDCFLCHTVKHKINDCSKFAVLLLGARHALKPETTAKHVLTALNVASMAMAGEISSEDLNKLATTGMVTNKMYLRAFKRVVKNITKEQKKFKKEKWVSFEKAVDNVMEAKMNTMKASVKVEEAMETGIQDDKNAAKGAIMEVCMANAVMEVAMMDARLSAKYQMVASAYLKSINVHEKLGRSSRAAKVEAECSAPVGCLLVDLDVD
ncbi:Hypothetical protein CINCED_3A025441 [Cinara cedri]|uniref:Uncharacterized protein n=1 Tax=Cinara cedri TaxID=506608 RepID=A0A5E4M5F9_9HEMI|nr:Hypothetical protein CINCED_3A025441 [Cinara cedri]